MMNKRGRASGEQLPAGCLLVRRRVIYPPIMDSLPETLDVAAIRLALANGWRSVTQNQFARRFGFSPGTVRDWEQGRRKPDGAARVLLFLIAHDAAGVEAAIRAAIAGDPVRPFPDPRARASKRVRSLETPASARAEGGSLL